MNVSRKFKKKKVGKIMVNVSGICFNENAIRNARQKEQTQNRNNTLKNVALIAVTPLAAKQVVGKVDPSIKKAVVDAASKGIDGFWKSLKYLGDNSKLFNKVENMIAGFAKKPSVKNILESEFMTKILRPITNAFYEKNGKVVLKYGAIGLLAYGALKTIQNHFENKGAIKEKYNV